MSQATESLRAARDQLLELRQDYDAAIRDFRWPEVGPTFNWGVDWFDEIARGVDRPALVIVETDGSRAEVTFDEMRRRSNRLARWLAEKGVRRGDSVIVMLGNQVALWETMLAIMKLGAVIMPTTTAVGPADLRDRIARGEARHVVVNPGDTGKFAEVPGDYTRISVGAAEGWHDLADAASYDDSDLEHPGTAPGDPLLLYFTSGTTSRPKLVEH